jgi:opacity protein-like surface antigen
MRRLGVLFCSILFAVMNISARAQAVPSATARQFSITAGGMASIFQTDFKDDWACAKPCSATGNQTWYPVAQSSNQPLFGVGAYVDFKLTRWVQLEAEGRWQRFNKYAAISQDNYLIGPRIPVYRLGRSTLYAKALAGGSRMTFDTFGDHGTFTDIAFGGGVDMKLTKRLSLRAVDFEYQYWPQWGNSTISPYGASMGIGYKIF